MLGDTAVAIHPRNERLKHLIGKTAILPLVGRRIPIIADDYADPEKGTGAVKITPAHDFNDFEVGKRHDLPLVNVLDVEGKLDLKDNAAFLHGVPSSLMLDETLTLTASTVSQRARESSNAWRPRRCSIRSSRPPIRCRMATARARSSSLI